MGKRSRQRRREEKQSHRRSWWAGIAALAVLAIAILMWRVAGRIFERPPQEPPAISQVGVDAYAATALTLARQRILNQPRDATSWAIYGQLLDQSGFSTEASECLSAAERLEPQSPFWPYLRGVRLLRSDAQRAAAHLQRAMDLCRESRNVCLTIHERLAETLIDLNENDDAAKILTAIVNEEKDRPRTRFNLALIAAAQGNDRQRAEHLAFCLQDSHVRKKATAQLAQALARMGKAEEAARLQHQATLLPPDELWPDPILAQFQNLNANRQSLEKQADQFERAGNIDLALRSRQQIVSTWYDADAFLSLGLLLAKLRRYDEAARQLELAAAKSKDRIQTSYLLATVAYFQAEQFSSNERTLQQSTEKYENAIRHYREVIRLRPEHGMAHLYLGISFLRLKRAEQALEPLQFAVASHPELIESHVSLAEAFALLGDKAQARTQLENASRLATDQTQIKDVQTRLGL